MELFGFAFFFLLRSSKAEASYLRYLNMNFMRKSKYKAAILIVVLLVVVFTVSRFTKKHDTNNTVVPGPVNAPVEKGVGPNAPSSPLK